MKLLQPPNWTHLFYQRCLFMICITHKFLSSIPFLLNLCLPLKVHFLNGWQVIDLSMIKSVHDHIQPIIVNSSMLNWFLLPIHESQVHIKYLWPTNQPALVSCLSHVSMSNLFLIYQCTLPHILVLTHVPCLSAHVCQGCCPCHGLVYCKTFPYHSYVSYAPPCLPQFSFCCSIMPCLSPFWLQQQAMTLHP